MLSFLKGFRRWPCFIIASVVCLWKGLKRWQRKENFFDSFCFDICLALIIVSMLLCCQNWNEMDKCCFQMLLQKDDFKFGRKEYLIIYVATWIDYSRTNLSRLQWVDCKTSHNRLVNFNPFKITALRVVGFIIRVCGYEKLHEETRI